jgi:hypothetical protein
MIELPIEHVERMTSAEENQFWIALEKALRHDDGDAAKSHLAAGHSVYYRDDGFPDGIVREWPDGRRELVSIDMITGDVTVTRVL